jgi:hypothetical protein
MVSEPDRWQLGTLAAVGKRPPGGWLGGGAPAGGSSGGGLARSRLTRSSYEEYEVRPIGSRALEALERPLAVPAQRHLACVRARRALACWRGIGAATALSATSEIESAATEEQHRDDDDEQRVRVHCLSPASA